MTRPSRTPLTKSFLAGVHTALGFQKPLPRIKGKRGDALTALHEAAHAVHAVDHCIPFTRVQIQRGRGSGVVIPRRTGTPFRIPNPTESNADVEHQSAKEDAICSLVGIAAEQRMLWLENPPKFTDGCEFDLRDAFNAIGDIVPDERDRFELMKKFMVEAQAWVYANESRIKNVAGHLLDEGELLEVTVHSILMGRDPNKASVFTLAS